MEHDKTIDVFNSLITINNDRIEGYETAANATDEQDLQTLFARFIAASQECRQDLVAEVSRLGGEVARGTKTSGKFFRVWMDVKAALTGKDRKAILNSCLYGEEQAQTAYKSALETNVKHVNAAQLSLISGQKSLLYADLNQVKYMRDALVDA